MREPGFDPAEALERRGRADARFRLLRSLELGLLLWGGFFAVDWMVARFAGAGRLWVLWGLRAAGLALIGAIAWRLRRGPLPTESALRGMDIAAYGGAAGLISLMCVEYGGLASPYAAGIPLVLLTHVFSVTRPWRDNLRAMIAPAAAWPATMAAAVVLVPEVRAQLQRPDQVAVALLSAAFILGSYGFLVAAGHEIWRLSRVVERTHSLGRYEMRGRLGRGGMGEVWRAWDRSLEREVALKVVLTERLGSGEALARFEREVRAISELAHPNTVRIFDFGITEEGVWYYAMELIEGVTLRELLEREERLPPARAVRLVRQAAGALAEAHARGMVHRDIKPSNLLVTEVGGEADVVKVLDFGIVHRVDEAERLTRAGVALGTVGYISPEILEGHPPTPAADVYALGAVFYELLCGAPAFDGPTGAVMARQLDAPPAPPSQVLGRPLPPALDALVLRCLEPGADRRLPDGAALVRALDRLLLW